MLDWLPFESEKLYKQVNKHLSISLPVWRYADLILRLEKELASANRHIEATLTVDGLKAIDTGLLYKKSKSYWDLAKAVAIYLKNYSERRR